MDAPGPPQRPAETGSTGGPRYFVALRPSARARRALGALAASLARRFGGRALAAEDIHLTLAFVGAAPTSIEAALRESVAPLEPPGTLSLGQLGHFGPRLLWIGPESPPPWLEAMVLALRAELDRRGIAYDARRFSPHATLVRGARPIDPDGLEAARRGLPPVPAGRMRVCVGASAGAPGPNRYRWLG